MVIFISNVLKFNIEVVILLINGFIRDFVLIEFCSFFNIFLWFLVGVFVFVNVFDVLIILLNSFCNNFISINCNGVVYNVIKNKYIVKLSNVFNIIYFWLILLFSFFYIGEVIIVVIVGVVIVILFYNCIFMIDRFCSDVI